MGSMGRPLRYLQSSAWLRKNATLAVSANGKTPTRRATCNRLDLNDEGREEPFIQNARQQWLAGGLHPLNDDPKQY